ncbi:hypothetical protein [Kamptonema formosum]|uniref:hypothetical protein n=1 Tax=Kamptonema formosum TaxID=331992 RepID=UPI00034DF1C3|nr:hypothetical protein [Oscillatoria sp. PCC 10802]
MHRHIPETGAGERRRCGGELMNMCRCVSEMPVVAGTYHPLGYCAFARKAFLAGGGDRRDACPTS